MGPNPNPNALRKIDVKRILSNSGKSLDDETLDALFKQIDVDGNDKLEYNEFELMMKSACNPDSGLPPCIDNFLESAKREMVKAKKARLSQYSKTDSKAFSKLENNPAAAKANIKVTELQKLFEGKTSELINSGSKQFWRVKTRVDYNIHQCEDLVVLQQWHIDTQTVYPEIWIQKKVVKQQLAMEQAANLANLLDPGGDASSSGSTKSAMKESVRVAGGRETFGGGRGSVVISQDFVKQEEDKVVEYISKRIKFVPNVPEAAVPGEGEIEISILTNDAFTMETLLYNETQIAEIKASGLTFPQPTLHAVTTSAEIDDKISAVNKDITQARRNSAAGEKYTKMLQISMDVFTNLYSGMQERKTQMESYSAAKKKWFIGFYKIRNRLQRNKMAALVEKYHPDTKYEKTTLDQKEEGPPYAGKYPEPPYGEGNPLPSK